MNRCQWCYTRHQRSLPDVLFIFQLRKYTNASWCRQFLVSFILCFYFIARSSCVFVCKLGVLGHIHHQPHAHLKVDWKLVVCKYTRIHEKMTHSKQVSKYYEACSTFWFSSERHEEKVIDKQKNRQTCRGRERERVRVFDHGNAWFLFFLYYQFNSS